MKTWEMIKELTENPNKKFISGTERNTRTMMARLKGGALVFEYENEEKVEVISLEREWEGVKKPVDFMTAIEALDGGKIIYAIRTDGYREIFNPAGKQTDWGVAVEQSQGYAVDTETILYGKWYIED